MINTLWIVILNGVKDLNLCVTVTLKTLRTAQGDSLFLVILNGVKDLNLCATATL